MFPFGTALILVGYSALYVAGMRLAGKQNTVTDLILGTNTLVGSDSTTSGTAKSDKNPSVLDPLTKNKSSSLGNAILRALF